MICSVAGPKAASRNYSSHSNKWAPEATLQGTMINCLITDLSITINILSIVIGVDEW